MKNCLSCGRAKDQGQDIKCGFNPKALLAQFPFFPVFLVKARAMPVKKDRVPGKDCPAWKPKKKPAEGGKDGE